MSRKTRKRAALTSIALVQTPEFGPAPILEGESREAYDELLARISSDAKPADIFERLWLRDIVDLTWEIFRYRRMKTSLLASERLSALENILSPLMRRQSNNDDRESLSPEERLVKKWAAKDPVAIKRVEKILASVNLTPDAAITGAFTEQIETYDHLDRMEMNTESRRNAALRELDRHRSRFAGTLKRSVQDVEEGEFETIEIKPITVKTSARKKVA